jgi:hypothetical protein
MGSQKLQTRLSRCICAASPVIALDIGCGGCHGRSSAITPPIKLCCGHRCSVWCRTMILPRFAPTRRATLSCRSCTTSCWKEMNSWQKSVTAWSMRSSATSTSTTSTTETSRSMSISGFGFTSFTGRLRPLTSPTATSLDQNTLGHSRCRSASVMWHISCSVPICTTSSTWD